MGEEGRKEGPQLVGGGCLVGSGRGTPSQAGIHGRARQAGSEPGSREATGGRPPGALVPRKKAGT